MAKIRKQTFSLDQYLKLIKEEKIRSDQDCQRLSEQWSCNMVNELIYTVSDRIFESVGIKEQGYNSALALLKLSNKYSETRLEAACEYAITGGIRKPRYHYLNAILASNQDIQYMEGKQAGAGEEPPMGYLRGSGYYGGGDGNAE